MPRADYTKSIFECETLFPLVAFLRAPTSERSGTAWVPESRKKQVWFMPYYSLFESIRITSNTYWRSKVILCKWIKYRSASSETRLRKFGELKEIFGRNTRHLIFFLSSHKAISFPGLFALSINYRAIIFVDKELISRRKKDLKN